MQNNNLRNEKIIIAATGASGMPILQECLHIIRQTPGYESVLIMSRSAVLTMEQEMECTREEMEKLADHIYSPEEIGAGQRLLQDGGDDHRPLQYEDSGRHLRRLCG